MQEREHDGKTMCVAGTSCRMVNYETFEKELAKNALDILEIGRTCIPSQFPQMMYSVVKKVDL